MDVICSKFERKDIEILKGKKNLRIFLIISLEREEKDEKKRRTFLAGCNFYKVEKKKKKILKF